MQRRTLFLGSLAAMLAACGGGGSSSDAIAAPATAAPQADTPAAAPPPAPRIAKTAVAHRGYPIKAPEDTLSSYAAAVSAGAKWVETDVYQTSDHQLVLMHDDTLVRTTDAAAKFPARSPWRIADFTLAEIRTLDAGSWFGPQFAGEKVPTLGELLEFLKPLDAGLYLEIKAAGDTPAKVAAELERTGWVANGAATKPLVVNSFNAAMVRAYHALHASVPTIVLLTAAPTAQQLADFEAFADGIAIPFSAIDDPILVSGASPLLANIGVYTVNGTRNIDTAIASPAKVIITDNIELLQQRLAG